MQCYLWAVLLTGVGNKVVFRVKALGITHTSLDRKDNSNEKVVISSTSNGSTHPFLIGLLPFITVYFICESLDE